MAGTGLKDLLGCVYEENTVPHLLSGKAISRAIRGHILASTALNTLLMSSALDLPLPSEEKISNPNLDNLESMDTAEAESVEQPMDTECDKWDDMLKKLDSIFNDLLNSKKAPTFANRNIELRLLK